MQKPNELNITDELYRSISYIVVSTSSFSYIIPQQLLICIASNKSGSRGGTYGKLVPLRFCNGAKYSTFRNQVYTIPEIRNDNHPILYIIYFYMPKFFDLALEEKIKVIFHELYHINPSFNGDIRRLGKSKVAHGGSRLKFDDRFSKNLDQFLLLPHPKWFTDFLLLNSVQLYKRYSRITGLRMQVPHPVPVQKGTLID